MTLDNLVPVHDRPDSWIPEHFANPRLVKKGALKFQTEGNRYVYSAAVTRNSTIKSASQSFLKSVFDGQTGPLIVHFVKGHQMSAEEIQELRDILNEKESK